MKINTKTITLSAGPISILGIGTIIFRQQNIQSNTADNFEVKTSELSTVGPTDQSLIYENKDLDVSFTHPDIAIDTIVPNKSKQKYPDEWYIHLGATLTEFVSIESFSNAADSRVRSQLDELLTSTIGETTTVRMCGTDAQQYNFSNDQAIKTMTVVRGDERTVYSLLWQESQSIYDFDYKTEYDKLIRSLACRI